MQTRVGVDCVRDPPRVRVLPGAGEITCGRSGLPEKTCEAAGGSAPGDCRTERFAEGTALVVVAAERGLGTGVVLGSESGGVAGGVVAAEVGLLRALAQHGGEPVGQVQRALQADVTRPTNSLSLQVIR